VALAGPVDGEVYAAVVDASHGVVTHTIVSRKQAERSGRSVVAAPAGNAIQARLGRGARLVRGTQTVGHITELWCDRQSGAITHALAQAGRQPVVIVAAEHIRGYGSNSVALKEMAPPLADLPIYRRDEAIARDVWTALLLVLPGPQTKRLVKLRVEDGAVDLGGQLETSEQVTLAAQAVKSIPGVRGLTVDLIARDAMQTQVEALLTPVLREQAVATGGVRVQCEHGIVYLEGGVPTRSARSALERAALAAPGVRVVVNNLAVGDEPPPSSANGTGPLVRNR